MGDRFIAQRLTTGEFLDFDVELKEPVVSRDLSGPGGITGLVNPEKVIEQIAYDGRPVLDEWTTALYHERDGYIRAGGIVQNLEWQGSVFSIDAPGFCSYAAGQPILKHYRPKKWEDPVRVFRNIWNYLQSFPDSNIGLKVRGPDTYLILGDGEGPYNISKYEYRDAGQELENIAAISPFDFVETHKWTDSSKTAIDHTLQIGFPRIGMEREDLRFVQGENMVRFSTVALDGSRFANTTYVLGNGEGAAMIVGKAVRSDGRLRRAAVVPRKAASMGLANLYAREELRGRAMEYDISEVVVKDHPNAPIAAINPGDDIWTDIDVPHIGRTAMNLRVLSVQEASEDTGRAVIKTMRSSYFVYASATSPTGKNVLVTV